MPEALAKTPAPIARLPYSSERQRLEAKSVESSSGGTTSEVPMSGAEQCVGLIENKLRNLGKRKQRLEDKKTSVLKGQDIKPEEKLAVEKLGEVELLIESFTDFEKQLKAIASDVAKKEKQEAKSREAERRKAEAGRYRELLEVRALLRLFAKHKAHFADGSHGAPKLSEVELKALEVAETRLFPTVAQIPADSADHDAAWNTLLDKAGTETSFLLNASPKVFHEPKLSFRDLHSLLFDKVRSSIVFSDEKTKAGKHGKKTTKEEAKKSPDSEISEAGDGTKMTDKKPETKAETKTNGGAKEDIPPQQNKDGEKKGGKGRNRGKGKREPVEGSEAGPKPQPPTTPPKAPSAEPTPPAHTDLVFIHSSTQHEEPQSSAIQFQAMTQARTVESPSAVIPQSDIQFLQPDHMEQQNGGVMMPEGVMVHQMLHLQPPHSIYSQPGYGNVYAAAEVGGGQIVPEPRGPPSPIPMPSANNPNPNAVPPPFVTQAAPQWGYPPPQLLWFPPPAYNSPSRRRRPTPLLDLELGVSWSWWRAWEVMETVWVQWEEGREETGLGLDSSTEWPSLGADSDACGRDHRRGPSLGARPGSLASQHAPTPSTSPSSHRPTPSSNSSEAGSPSSLPPHSRGDNIQAAMVVERARAGADTFRGAERAGTDSASPRLQPDTKPFVPSSQSFLDLWRNHQSLLEVEEARRIPLNPDSEPFFPGAARHGEWEAESLLVPVFSDPDLTVYQNVYHPNYTH